MLRNIYKESNFAEIPLPTNSCGKKVLKGFREHLEIWKYYYSLDVRLTVLVRNWKSGNKPTPLIRHHPFLVRFGAFRWMRGTTNTSQRSGAFRSKLNSKEIAHIRLHEGLERSNEEDDRLMTTNHESQQRTRSYLKMPRGGFAEDYHAHSCELKRSDEPEELNDPEDRREPEDAEEQEPEEPVDPKHEEPGKHGERLDENPGNDESSGTPEDHEYPAQDHREHPSGRGDILQQISNGWNPKDFLCYCCYKKSLHLLREWSRSTLPIETRPQRIPPGSTWSIERGIPLPPHPGHPYSTASRAGTRMSRELFASNPYLIPPLISLRSRPLRFHSPSLASDSIRSPPHSRAPPFHNPYSSHRSSNKSESSRPFLPHASASLALASHAPPSLAASHQHPNLALIHQPPPRLSTSSSNPLPPPRNHPYAQGRCFENKVHPRHPPYAYNSQTQQPRRACAQKGPIPRDRNRFAVTLGWPVYDHHITTARHSKHKRNTLREFEAPQPAAARAPAAYAQEGSSQEKTSQRSRRKRGRSEKNIACTYCNKRFKYLGNLKNHIRTHTGERPFKCSICTKGFAQISNLRRHRKTHEKKSKKKRTT